jgi:hypothetical protein
MCPNINTPESTACPPFRSKPETPCRFVKAYVDERGRPHKVVRAGMSKFMPMRRSAAFAWRWIPMPLNFETRTVFDRAQADLNRYAKEQGWAEWT